MSTRIIPVILAGGKGRRLRPLTGSSRPKPFIRLFGKHSLFQKTVLRLSFAAAPVVVLHEHYKHFAEQQLREIGICAEAIITEPEQRSTAPAIALAALYLQGRGDDTVMLVTPSDHYIKDAHILHNAILRGEGCIRNTEAKFVSIGAAPDRLETRFGYIRYDDDFNILNFKEKPDRQTAKSYIDQGNCAWNTGMFLCRPADYLEALNEYRPEIFKAVQNISTYDQSFSEAVDTAIMENLKGAKLALLETKWRDLGVWPEFLRYFSYNVS